MLRLSFVFLMTLSVSAWSTEERHRSIPELMHTVSSFSAYSETAISPDGRLIAWAQSVSAGANTAGQGSSVFISASRGSSFPVRISAASGSPLPGKSLKEHGLAWSPDSQSLAFLSDATSPGQEQLYSMRLSDRKLTQITHIKGYLATPQWAPSGREIAVLLTENAVRSAGPLSAVAPVTGIVDEKVYEQRIAVVNLATGALRAVTPDDLYVYEYDWSPDSKGFVATAARGSGDNHWYVAALYRFDGSSGSAQILYKPSEQIALPRWAPDGNTIAFLSGLMSDEPVANGDLYAIAADGGAARRIVALSGSGVWLSWALNSREILLVESRDGASAIDRVDSVTGAVKTLWSGPETIRGSADFFLGVSLAKDGKTSALIRESYTEPPAVWSGSIGEWKRVSPAATEVSVPWGSAESIHWQSDEFTPQGWLLAPRTVEANRKYPLIVWIHGGPAYLNSPTWPVSSEGPHAALFAGAGYFVFFPNPRGSAGFGERFKRANVKDFGGGDLRDILEGIRKVVRTQPIDDSRVGLSGWSYGGYMTMWALTQTQRFRAAVVGAGLSDWLSYYGENGIDEWMLPYFGASVYDDPQVYAKSSPINFVKNVRTPTLLVVGDGDIECPPPQSFEYWHALKSFGVKTELVVYPNEGHRFENPQHTQDVVQRMIAWFDDNMPASPER